tara:strand:+ start:423 stop:821 length:399 start_codon:yes stop_codon:yes gene_type:complete
MNKIGKKIWIFPDAYLPSKGHAYETSNDGFQYGHESLCILNISNYEAILKISFYFEDTDPYKNFEKKIDPQRSLHLRLDNLDLPNFGKLEREKPYSILLKSNIKIVAQLSRLDTTTKYNSFMTVMGWGEDDR